MAKGISGRVALVTGGASGMGRATSIAFADAGAKVAVVTGSNIKGAEETVKMIKDAGGDAIFIQCDVSKESDVEKMLANTVEHYGSLDFAFNNAGIGPDGKRIPYGPLTELTEKNFDIIVNTNFKGVFLCMKHELRQMCRQKSGVIVNNASVGGLKMAPGFGAYGPSKSAVIAITKTAALENAKNGIRVNVVCPGPTSGTNLMDNTLAANPAEADMLTQHVIPMGRLGRTEDVCNAVLWLCSDESAFTTGLAVSVDGGMSA